MDKYIGFSLTEVLVSLLLMSSMAMPLLGQQLKTIHFFHMTNQKIQKGIELDNASEHAFPVFFYHEDKTHLSLEYHTAS